MPANAMAAPQALLAALRLLRREFAVCVVFSLVANLLMVTPALLCPSPNLTGFIGDGSVVGQSAR